MRIRFLPALLALVVLAGCGGSKSGDGAATATTTTQAGGSAAQAAAVAKVRAANAKRMQGTTAPARSCLRRLGYKVSDGSPRLNDDRAPDYQLVLNERTRGHGAIIAYYNDLARAAHYGAITRKNTTKLHDATLERRGEINIVWIGLHDAKRRDGVRSCILRSS
ncbi:MAG TPA: hypothetical protein VG871_17900 [Vicinamibacterales bacterium]|nr:hypothetical protein [Vicinamibacterales bacterium]